MRQLQRALTKRSGMSPSNFSGAVTLLRYAIRIPTGTLAALKEFLRSILKHDQQSATLYNTIYYCQRCTCFERFSANHQELKSVHAASVICQTYLLLPLAVTANKFDKYLTLHVQIWAPDNERKNRSKHVECWQQQSITQRCILMVILKNALKMHGPMNVTIPS
jgi:hypothetical protein